VGAADLHRSIDADIDSTLQRLYATVSGSRNLVAKTSGVLLILSSFVHRNTIYETGVAKAAI
jgi:hypothetical protein